MTGTNSSLGSSDCSRSPPVKKWKIAVAILVVIAISGGVYANYKFNQKGIVTVQTGKVARQDLLSLVTASGEVKPKNYINIGCNTNTASRITGITVAEGQRVRKGQLLAKLESVQPEADVAAMKASVSSSEAE